MMRILSDGEIEILNELWLEDLPRRILDTVCQSPDINQAAVLRLFVKSLPASIDPQNIYDRCLSSIYWFLHHGDIATSGNRRYVAIPPYAVPIESLDGKTILTIFGDSRLDQYVADSIGEIGCRLERRMVTWRWENRNEDSTPNVVGFLRNILTNAMQYREIVSRFALLKIPIIQPHELQARLPSIRELKTPSKTVFTSVPPNWGYWDSYAPYFKELLRWKPVTNWSTLRAGMLRWRPSDDRHGETSARFFLVKDSAQLFELSSTSARLWALFLDWRESNPKRFWMCH